MNRLLLLLTLAALVLPLAHAQAPLHTLASPNPEINGGFGTAASGVPDADGDGRGDLLIGVWQENGGAADAGRAYLYSGATGTLLYTLVSPSPEVAGAFGVWADGVPDADGDGRGDLLIGAGREAGGAPDAGRAYLYSGATGALLHAFVSPNPDVDGFFSLGISGVPDADGDGRGDLLIGAFQENGGAADAGWAYLYSGATGALLRTLQSPNPEVGGGFGYFASGVGDTDGDGRGDLLVSAVQEDGGATDAGRAYLYSGATGALLHTLVSPNPETAGRFGESVASVPDADGDGRDDLLVGAMDENGGAGNAGRAYLYSGATGALLRTLVSPSPEGGGQLGFFASGVEDADGDGRGDLLVGAFGENGGATDAGRAYLYSGGTSVATEPDAEALGVALVAEPNPAHGAALLRLTLDRPQVVTLGVYDGLGRRVAVLHDGPLAAGAHALPLDAAALPPGLYVLRLTAGGEAVTRRLTVVQ